MLTATASASCDSRCSILTLRDCLRGLNLARPVLTFCSRQNRPLWNVHVTRDFAQTDARGVCRANFCPRRFCYDALHIVLINAVEPFFPMQIGFGIALQSTSEQARREHRRASRYGNLRHSPLNDWCGPSSRGLFEIRVSGRRMRGVSMALCTCYFLDNHHKLAARLLELNDEH